jgi:hypothetical protein
MRIIPLSVAFAIALPASMAMAQQFDVEGMSDGLSMIELNAENAFKKYKIDADPQTLTVAQLARIVGILSDPNGDSGGNTYKASIEATIRNQ